MDTQRDRLRELDQETLIDTIEVLEQRVTSLEKQGRELKKLRQLPSEPAVRLPKTPQNSSKPSGQSEKAQLAQRVKGKRGPKAGHPGKSGQNSTPNEVVDCLAKVCSQGGQGLAELPQQLLGSRQGIDLPPFEYMVREARCYGVACPRCGPAQRGSYPAGFELGRTFGQRLEQVARYLPHAHPLSYQRLQPIFRDL
jgi:hypothetical protein